MAKKTNLIDNLVADKKKEIESKYGKNFHSMYEFEGLVRTFVNVAEHNIKKLKKVNRLLQDYAETQDVQDQLKIEATRTELKDYSICGIQALINCAATLDNFNFNEMLGYD